MSDGLELLDRLTVLSLGCDIGHGYLHRLPRHPLHLGASVVGSGPSASAPPTSMGAGTGTGTGGGQLTDSAAGVAVASGHSGRTLPSLPTRPVAADTSATPSPPAVGSHQSAPPGQRVPFVMQGTVSLYPSVSLRSGHQ